jgi:hypothetical protein
LFYVNNNPSMPLLSWRWLEGDIPVQVPVAITDSGVNLDKQANRLFSASRTVGRSHTFELDCSSLSNTGRVFAVQIENPTIEGLIGYGPTVTPAGLTGAAQHLKFDVRGQTKVLKSLPTGLNNNLLQCSPSSYTGAAKEGLFMPVRYSQPNIPYKGVQDGIIGSDVPQEQSVPPVGGYAIGIAEDTGLTVSKQYIYGTVTGDLVPKFHPSGELPDGQYYTPILQRDDDMMNGWVLFTGLNPTASVSVKTVQHLECRVDRSTSWLPFMEPSIIPDSLALDSAYTLRSQMADAFPARYNLFGSFFSKMSSLAPMLMKAIDSPIGQSLLEAIPGGSTINALQKGVRSFAKGDPVSISKDQISGAITGAKKALRRRKR